MASQRVSQTSTPKLTPPMIIMHTGHHVHTFVATLVPHFLSGHLKASGAGQAQSLLEAFCRYQQNGPQLAVMAARPVPCRPSVDSGHGPVHGGAILHTRNFGQSALSLSSPLCKQSTNRQHLLPAGRRHVTAWFHVTRQPCEHSAHTRPTSVGVPG